MNSTLLTEALREAEVVFDELARQILSPSVLKDQWASRSSAIAQARETLELIDQLREEEGAAVTINSDNADFNGRPNCLIEVTDDWTDWEAREFTGDTILEALRTVAAARKAATTPQAPWSQEPR